MRAVLLLGMIASAAVPLTLLAVWSVSGQWLFPALLPRAVTAEGWRALAGGSLGAAVATSSVLAVATGLLSCAVALPVGRSLATLRGRRRHLAAAAVFLPVAAPPIALATGLHVAALAAGVAGTGVGVLLAHLVPAVGYLSLFFLGVFSVFDDRAVDEARTLGASPWQTWRLVTLPMLRVQIAEAVAVGFLISWTQFPLTLVVGGGAVRALPLEVFAYVRSGQDRLAAVGALLLIVPAAAAIAGLRWGARRGVVAPA